MFGWINDCCESLVVTKFGIEKWHEIKELAGCKVEDGGFIRHQYYRDESSVNLVVAISKVLGISVAAVLETFGQYFYEFTREAGYGNMLSCQGSNLNLWLSNLNALHDHLQDTLPRGRFPEFWCEDDLEVKESLLLHYFSERGSLFVPFVVGLVKEIAHFHFRLKVKLDILQTQGEDGASYTTWRIATTDPSQMHKMTENIGWAEKTSDLEETLKNVDIREAANSTGCPFHAMEREARNQSITEKDAQRFWSRAVNKNDNVDNNTAIHENISDHSNNLGDEWRFSLNTEAQTVTQQDEKSSSHQGFMSNENMKEIFPFHVLVNEAFNILQAGNSLHGMLGLKSPNFLLGKSLSDLFDIKRPHLASWDWKAIKMLQDQTFYLQSKGGFVRKVNMKAHFIELSASPKHVLVTISPHAKNIEQLRKLKLTLSDLPNFTYQRDAIFLGEHMLSGIRSSHKLDKLSRKLANEHNLSNTLLYSMLPPNVAKILRSGKPFEPAHHDNVTLFFSDVVGFTDMCSNLPPWGIIDMLNRLYTVMDHLATKFNLYKVETIGDAYMCCSGLPNPNTFHAQDVVNFALAVRECVLLVTSPLTGEPIRLRMGIHSGSCMSGVVGSMTPHYCLFGDMINTTSRHESTGEPEKIQCSSVTYEKLRNSKNPEDYNFTPRGLVEMKGKGKLFTYWLDSAGEKNPFVGSAALKETVEEVTQMLKAKAWKKRSYFPKRKSESTFNSTLEDEHSSNEEPHSRPVPTYITSQDQQRPALLDEKSSKSIESRTESHIYIENNNLIKNITDSNINVEELMADDLSVNIRRVSMVGSTQLDVLSSKQTEATTDDTDDTEDHDLLNHSYHHLQIDIQSKNFLRNGDDKSPKNSSYSDKKRDIPNAQISSRKGTIANRPEAKRRSKPEVKRSEKREMQTASRKGTITNRPEASRRSKAEVKKIETPGIGTASRKGTITNRPEARRRYQPEVKRSEKQEIQTASRKGTITNRPEASRRSKAEVKRIKTPGIGTASRKGTITNRPEARRRSQPEVKLSENPGTSTASRKGAITTPLGARRRSNPDKRHLSKGGSKNDVFQRLYSMSTRKVNTNGRKTTSIESNESGVRNSASRLQRKSPQQSGNIKGKEIDSDTSIKDTKVSDFYVCRSKS